jgi:hypothetical protein
MYGLYVLPYLQTPSYDFIFRNRLHPIIKTFWVIHEKTSRNHILHQKAVTAPKCPNSVKIIIFRVLSYIDTSASFVKNIRVITIKDGVKLHLIITPFVLLRVPA